LLADAGYEVAERPVNRPEHQAALRALGFDSVPVVEAGGRAFPGFPLASLERALGLSRRRFSATAARRDLVATLDLLDEIAEALPRLPAALWDRQAYPLNTDRDHTLGHLAWSVYRMVELVLAAPASGGLPWSELVDSTEMRYWRRRDEFTSFAGVRDYGLPLLAAARRWKPDANALRQLIDTPWGRIELHALLGILGEHSRMKASRLRDELAAVRNSGPPPH
jgi:hypothetical protein